MSEPVCRYCQERLGHPNNGLCDECQSVQDEATKPLHVRIEALERELAEAREAQAFYRRRCDMLQSQQRCMRDPERKMVCDILANGAMANEGYTLNPSAEVEAAFREGYKVGFVDSDDLWNQTLVDAAWSRYQQEREGGEGR